MFTVTYKGFPVACETAQDAVQFIDAADKPTIQATTTTTTRATTRKPRTKTKRTKPDRAEKNKRNAKARESYHFKQKTKKLAQATTTTSRLEALPSKPTHIGRGRPEGGKRARTSQAVMDTLKRSPSPLTLDEIDMDLEKSGWPYKGQDRKGAIRATLARLKANGTVTAFLRGTGLEAMQMFRLERTNGDTPTPVEQVLNNKFLDTANMNREERAEVEDSEAEAAAAEARAEAEPDAREF
jgi:hypothetical protein